MIDTASPPATHESRFVEQLCRMTDNQDRRGLAILRRSLADPGGDFAPYTVLGHVLPADGAGWKVNAYLLLAGLYALHPHHVDDGRTLGASLRQMRASLDSGQDSLDLLVGAVLNAHEEDVPVRLRHLFGRLASGEIAVDYTQLLRDLLYWGSIRRTVQQRWARDYWLGARADNEAEQQEEVGNDSGE